MKYLGIFYKPELFNKALSLKNLLLNEGYTVDYCESSERIKNNKVDLTIVLGGDGTFLKASHLVNNPLVGFKGGRLGFLSSYTIEEFDKFLKDLKNDNFVLDERTFLKVSELNAFCLNEVLLIKDPDQKMVDIKISFQDGELFFHADGIMLGTPTGSTGYSLSLGGPILLPNTKAFVITPVAPQFLASRSIVIPDNEKVNIEVDESVNLIIDGANFGKFSKVTVLKSKKKISILRPIDYDFTKSIKEKLGYGKKFL
ncbi:NAD+ kinase [Thermosipho japonicus]|uniref:NAD kinase n=1 Tax=Thermosipho japonicus TaxID=90323 RepID=A0A841GH81_9BACT|nr:NAD(+) kinase [Thermosipho japonicus]MBB6062972.1 NAD+ kinase [Thermosipho japonicus]